MEEGERARLKSLIRRQLRDDDRVREQLELMAEESTEVSVSTEDEDVVVPAETGVVRRPAAAGPTLTVERAKSLVPGVRGDVFCVEVLVAGERCRTRAVALAGPDRTSTVAWGQEFDLDAAGDLLSPPCLHIVLMSRYNADAESGWCVLGTQTVDLRRFLVPGRGTRISVELLSTGASQIPVGVLDMQVSVAPSVARGMPAVNRETLEATQRTEGLKLAEALQVSRERCLAWIEECRRASPECAARVARTRFSALDELRGELSLPCFVVPTGIELRQGVDTPFHASRMVSLLQRDESRPSGGTGILVIRSPHSVLSSSMASEPERAVVLCSLLRCFGLDAFVCCGLPVWGSEQAWWVLELRLDGGGPVLWEPETGSRYDLSTCAEVPMRELDALFDGDHFFLNAQPSGIPSVLAYDLSDRRAWRPMPSQPLEILATLLPHNRVPVLERSPFVQDGAHGAVPAALEQLIAEYRKAMGLGTNFDRTGLRVLLCTALYGYEQDALFGSGGPGASCHETFERSLRRSLPDGHTFKAFPASFHHCSPGRILASLTRSPVAVDILGTKMGSPVFGLSLRYFYYPEGTFVLWVMLAMRCAM